MKKIGSLISCLVPFLYLKILSYFAVLTIQSIYVKVNKIPYRTTNVSIDSTHLVIMGIIAIIIYSPIFIIWYLRLLEKEERNYNKRIFSLKSFLCIFVIGLSLQIILAFTFSFIYNIKPEWYENYHELMNTIVKANLLSKFISIVVLGPIIEELVFRGVILKKSRGIMPFIVANILQSLLFGISHGNFVQGLYTFILGLFLGFLYLKTRTIIAPIGVHMAFNMGSIILESINLELNNILRFPIVGAIIFLTAIASMILFTNILIINFKNEKIGNLLNNYKS